jgi:hypothetical protein
MTDDLMAEGTAPQRDGLKAGQTAVLTVGPTVVRRAALKGALMVARSAGLKAGPMDASRAVRMVAYSAALTASS